MQGQPRPGLVFPLTLSCLCLCSGGRTVPVDIHPRRVPCHRVPHPLPPPQQGHAQFGSQPDFFSVDTSNTELLVTLHSNWFTGEPHATPPVLSAPLDVSSQLPCTLLRSTQTECPPYPPFGLCPGTTQRHPRVVGRVHVFNNVYQQWLLYAIGVTCSGQVRTFLWVVRCSSPGPARCPLPLAVTFSPSPSWEPSSAGVF